MLGCKLRYGEERLVGAAARRSECAAKAYFNRPDSALVVVSGGRAWQGLVEADAIAHELEHRGVPRPHLLRERWSHSTRENAQYAGYLLRARGIASIELVTCGFHMARATLLFEHEGFAVSPSPSTLEHEQSRGPLARLLQFGRERGAMLADARFVERSGSRSRT